MSERILKLLSQETNLTTTASTQSGAQLLRVKNTHASTAFSVLVKQPPAEDAGSSLSTFTFGEDFTQTIIGGTGEGSGYIRVEDVNYGDPISTRMYEFLSTLTAGTEITVYAVVDSTTYNAVISFTEFAGGEPASTSRNDIYYTQVSGDELPFSYSATELTLAAAGSAAVPVTTGSITIYPGEALFIRKKAAETIESTASGSEVKLVQVAFGD
jgi:hypothetical protein